MSIVGGAVSSSDAKVRPTSVGLFVRCSSVASALLPVSRGVRGVLRNPLLRTGYLLTLSSGSAAVVGAFYWMVAAWKYAPAAMGRNMAAVSLMMMVSIVGQLNLSSAMVRFVPTAGQQTRRLVVGAHLACGCMALFVGIGCVVLVPIISPGANFLEGSLPAAMFVVASIAYPMFVMQDGILVGLRQAALVPVKNFAFAVIKLALVVVVAGAMPLHGILASWVLALVAVEVAATVYLLRRAVPGHQRRERVAQTKTLPPVSQIARFVAADYGGAVCAIASIDLMPVMVISTFGAERNAYFSIAWLIAYSLQLVNINMGTSLVAETAGNPARLTEAVRHVIAHTTKLLVPTVTLIVLAAPLLLGVFGAGYRSATDTLRLLALAALPHLLVSTAISSARVRGRLRLLVWVQAAQCAMVLPLTWLLLHVVGPSAPGWAWLIAQCVLAGGLLIRRDLWFGVDSGAVTSPARARNGVAPAMPILIIVLRLLTALRVRRIADRAAAWVRTRRAGAPPIKAPTPEVFASSPGTVGWTTLKALRTVSDVSATLVGPKHGPPAAVLKIARTALGAAELRAQRRILAELATDPRLDEQWRALLPRVLAFDDSADATLAVESYRPGVDLAEVLAREPDRVEELTIAALVAMAPLHRQTSTRVVVDDTCLLRRWVGEPHTDLTEACRRMDPRVLAEVDRLHDRFREALAGRRMSVSWTHGDYTPSNVRLAGAGGPVTGFVDWGGARPARLPLIDEYLMILAASCQVERADLGAVITARLKAGGLSDRERNALHTAHRLSNWGNGHGWRLDDGLDECTAILLTWLHHAADTWRRCGTYRTHPLWWAANVAPVLRAVAAEPACGSGKDHV
jgi:O-antigen/teichoic acid export membrane protein